ncbi:FtsX-like permease family protein [Mucilaginibacter sp.]|jgi:putative ABC transport system permease protein|uniref:FtsX-like permease family protein n=1 Tax=Mucilaginibacter sp. TaxID=1882438 RepID=UPI002B6E52C0|nr:FtsX-like permease family protein [Mucilaginibacter sp.]HTI61820.1 FtsX-like permease family protein [Mucilaginibacter sp.]
MIKNYFKIALRNIQRNKLYSLINIAGLTIGLTACLLVATVVLDDLSYDHQWKNADNIYRIISIDQSSKNAIQQFPQSFTGLGPTFKKTFPEVEEYCRMHTANQRFKMGSDKDGVKIHTLSAEPSVWDVLNFDVVEGKPQVFVKGYDNMVISEKVRKLYFPNSDPVGKIVVDLPEFGKPVSYMITGVIKDIPANSTLRADILTIGQMRPDDDIVHAEGYGTYAEQYLLLKPGASAKVLQSKANKWIAGYFANKEMHYSVSLQPMKDIYLRSADLSGGGDVKGDIKNVYIFSGVAIFLLLIACINFVNLTTARALKRVREAGIRKVLGADRRELIAQFLFESLLFFCISFGLSMFLYIAFLKPVETYLGHPLTITLQNNILLFGITCGIMLIVSVLTGIYPALLVSAQNPISTLKGKISEHVGSNFLRKALVVIQFTISVAVLTVTIIVQKQLHFMDNKDLGYDKNNLLRFSDLDWNGKGNAFKHQVLSIPGVENASIATWYPESGGGGYMTLNADDPTQKGNKLKVWYINADFDFVNTMKFHLLKGRLLDPKFSKDAINADSLMAKGGNKLDSARIDQSMLISAYTAKMFSIKTLGQTVKGATGTPVGIINNFNNESLKEDMKPVFISASKSMRYGSMLMRIQPGSEKAVLTKLYKAWQHFFPDKVFDYAWVDQELNKQYAAEQKLQQMFATFSFLILTLAALGLFGLTTFIAEMKIKEIGIRKVLGASVSAISVTLSKDFIKLILISIIVASPVAWYFANKWLQNYAYKITLSWWLFALSGLGAILIAIITISYQTIKSATANPVKSLRSE